jgi:hypothetical protein
MGAELGIGVEVAIELEQRGHVAANGVGERIGERRWRIVFPYPHFESLADVIELTPLPPESR